IGVVFVICHHPHTSDTRLSITTQQLYLATPRYNLTLVMFHLVYNQYQRLIIHLFYNTLFYSLISNSINNPLSSTIIYRHRNLLFQHPLP
ncbi:hypothetical protein BCR42DRAFT_416263, partial [Absidia repens]